MREIPEGAKKQDNKEEPKDIVENQKQEENQEEIENQKEKRPDLRVKWKSELYVILNPSARKVVDGLTGKTNAFKGFTPSFY